MSSDSHAQQCMLPKSNITILVTSDYIPAITYTLGKSTVKKERLTKTTLVYLGQSLNPNKIFKATIPFHSPTPPSPTPSPTPPLRVQMQL